jgi:hypothetical protein
MRRGADYESLTRQFRNWRCRLRGRQQSRHCDRRGVDCVLGIGDLPRHVRVQRRAVLLVPKPHDYHLVHTRSDADRCGGSRARNHPLYTFGNLGACRFGGASSAWAGALTRSPTPIARAAARHRVRDMVGSISPRGRRWDDCRRIAHSAAVFQRSENLSHGVLKQELGRHICPQSEARHRMVRAGPQHVHTVSS